RQGGLGGCEVRAPVLCQPAIQHVVILRPAPIDAADNQEPRIGVAGVASVRSRASAAAWRGSVPFSRHTTQAGRINLLCGQRAEGWSANELHCPSRPDILPTFSLRPKDRNARHSRLVDKRQAWSVYFAATAAVRVCESA